MRRTILVTSCLIACLATACQRAPQAPAAAQATAATTQAVASTRVGNVTLQTSTVATADINTQIAQRYGIDAGTEGLMLLVTVRASLFQCPSLDAERQQKQREQRLASSQLQLELFT